MRVAKWQGLGNHFLVVEEPPWPLTPERVRLLCDAALGLGADGVLEVELGDGEVCVVVHNRDGSIAEISGNGTRIAAAYAAERMGRSELRVHTGAGEGEARIGADGRIAVRLGQASLEGPQENLAAPDPGVAYRFVSTGNPHCVLTVDDPEAFALSETGPRLELHARFPERTNVEAVAPLDRHRLRMRVWERGVGETQACGSGACAAAVAAIVDGHCESPVTVEMPGGSVEVGVDGTLGLTLTGTAQRVYVAELDPALLDQLEQAGLMRGSSRLDGVPEYLSTRLMRTVAEARERGVDVIALGIGDPDTPPPAELREALCAQARRDEIHGYPTNLGIAPLREAVAGHYQSRFGVELDPASEILPLLGAKEGLAHLCLAQLDPGDVALVADPGYPVYYGGPALAGGKAVGLPLRAENAFLPDLGAIDAAAARRAGLLICGYPNNPTGAVADVAFFERLAAWGAEHGVPICHDNAYGELTYDGLVAPSFLAAPGAREAGIEIYSLSKSLSLPGWRMAFAVGNAELIGRLRTLKTNIDSGMWLALQHAAITAVELIPSFTAGLRELYGRRRDVLCDGLEALGMDFVRPRGALYVWMRVPGAEGSVAFAERLLERAAVVVGPGAAYGPTSDGYVRLSLTAPEQRLAEAVERIGRAL